MYYYGVGATLVIALIGNEYFKISFRTTTRVAQHITLKR
jgi:hypothetical protein